MLLQSTLTAFDDAVVRLDARVKKLEGERVDLLRRRQEIIDAFRDFERSKARSRGKSEAEAAFDLGVGVAAGDKKPVEVVSFSDMPRECVNGIWTSPWPMPTPDTPGVLLDRASFDHLGEQQRRASTIEGYVHASWLIYRQRLGDAALDRLAELAKEREAAGHYPIMLDTRFANCVFDASVAETGYQLPEGFDPLPPWPARPSPVSSPPVAEEDE